MAAVGPSMVVYLLLIAEKMASAMLVVVRMAVEVQLCTLEAKPPPRLDCHDDSPFR
jgi:hypothetical protein